MHTFYKGQAVRFTRRARRDTAIRADDKNHLVTEVEIVSNGYQVPPDYAHFDGALGAYAGKRTRELVGHHQWLVLENGKTYSGMLLRPA